VQDSSEQKLALVRERVSVFSACITRAAVQANLAEGGIQLKDETATKKDEDEEEGCGACLLHDCSNEFVSCCCLHIFVSW
jgi:hypothetical protein